ncbi:LuxR C-terminal-related transcriptional regulator [Variovorax boronicumulans]|uniref:LuxR C-terminal-related transcriptional regulator n=1 Tax=Variovorax boronicumulans TaxID=436515 RepID=UPI0007805D39|nr:LuxR C-terminal-related transcriptional regulator [Variovorax boronicumulans]
MDLNTAHAGDGGGWSLALIHTKMTPPRLAGEPVGRPALLDLLAQVAHRRLTAIVAPAGFGKTTLMTEWHEALRKRGDAVAWLTLDEEDDDAQQLGHYLVSALSAAAGGVGLRAAELLQRDPLTPIKTVQAMLLNEIARTGCDVFLFLDDFERIGSRASLALVTRLLRYAPANFHVCIGTRREPGLPLGAWAMPDQVLTLDAAALRFSNEDALAFFERAHGVLLDRPGVELINTASEGWVTGLQLAALALRHTDEPARLARELAGKKLIGDAYLYEVVLSRMPVAVLQFALRVSVLDRFCSDVCDAMIKPGTRSWEKLEWLQQHNMFIRALDDEQRWFRFHTLMADALRRRAGVQLGGELTALHRRASRWFAGQRLWPEAVRHAIAAGDAQQAVQWAEGCAAALIDRSDIPTLLGWFSQLPADLVQRSLRLRIARAWGLTLSFRIAEAERLVQEIGDEITADALREDARADSALPAELASVSALIAGFADDTPRSLELGRKVEEAEAPTPVSRWARRFAQTSLIFGLAYDGQFGEVRRRAATPQEMSDGEPIYSSVYRQSMVGLGAMVEGRLADAARILESALLRAETAVGRDSAAAAVPSGYLVALHYERGDMAAACRVMDGRTSLAKEACPLGSLLRFSLGSARLYARQGDVASALVVLEEAREVATERYWLRLRAGCDAEAVRLLLQAGRLTDAQQVLAELNGLMPARHPQPMGSFLETWSSACCASARVAMAQGRPEAAVELLLRLRGQLDAAGMRYLSACVSQLLALAWEQQNESDEAIGALDAALRYASVEPMVSSFNDEGAPMLHLMDRLRGDTRSVGQPYLPLLDDRLQGGQGQGTTPLNHPAPSPVLARFAASLSVREIEILEHIAGGLSNKEIARALSVAPETIKWHLKNIFEKLNVGSRLEAVQAGLGLGFAPLRETR